jgi:hypothetical protein
LTPRHEAVAAPVAAADLHAYGLRWADLEDMPKGELLDLLEFLRG